MTRDRWDVHFLKVADLVSTRSTCLKRQFGAVIVKDSQIISTGYNGAAKGLPHCTDTGECTRKDIPHGQNYELCCSVHAEANAIIQAAKHGISTKDAVLYVNGCPCVMCARMIVNSGIRAVVTNEFPKEDLISEAIIILQRGGVAVIKCRMR